MTLLVRLLTWFGRWAARVEMRARNSTGRVPDYVPCPFCAEPEVEVWSGETVTRCHNCGKTFDVPRTES
jgi:transposase-like protein